MRAWRFHPPPGIHSGTNLTAKTESIDQTSTKQMAGTGLRSGILSTKNAPGTFTRAMIKVACSASSIHGSFSFWTSIPYVIYAVELSATE
jgi:hypothetical protein